MKKLAISKSCLIICLIILVSALSVAAVYAIDAHTQDSSILVTDAIKACDVCEAHLVQNCTECGGNELYSSYRTICPNCNTSMTLCCSEQVAEDDYYNSCLVMGHPADCNTVQDLYWNAYYCNECGHFQRGTRSDDYHIEAYWHTKADCYDHTYCSLPRLSDLLRNSENNNPADEEKDSTSHTYENKYEAAVAAGDYCEICGTFGCRTLHEDK